MQAPRFGKKMEKLYLYRNEVSHAGNRFNCIGLLRLIGGRFGDQAASSS